MFKLTLTLENIAIVRHELGFQSRGCSSQATLMTPVTVFEDSIRLALFRTATRSPIGKARTCKTCADRRGGHFGLAVRSYERQFYGIGMSEARRDWEEETGDSRR